MNDHDEFYEHDDYDEERPRDDKIDAAKTLLGTNLFAADADAVYYQRQIETKYEGTYFHWITAKALNELAEEAKLSTELQALSGNVKIRFYWNPRNRYWRRRANEIRKLVLKFSDSTMAHAIGQQGEMMFDAALPRVGLLPISPFKKIRTFGDRSWTTTNHDLDRAYSCDGVNYGVEVKNTLSYIDKDELDTKLAMCRHLGLRPLFIMRMAPKSYMHQIHQQGGFGLLFGKQLYPYGASELAKRVVDDLTLPVECVREVAEGHLLRFKNWHQKLLARLNG